MQTIELDGYSLNFPDEMSQKEMDSVIQSAYSNGTLKRQSPSAGQQLSAGSNAKAEMPSRASQYMRQAMSQVGNDPLTHFVNGAGDQFVNSFKNIANTVVPDKWETPLSKNGSGLAYDIGGIGGDVLAYSPLGSILNAGRIGLSTLSKAPSIVKKAAASLSGDGARGVARRGLGATLYGATQNPDDRMKMGLSSGALSVGVDALAGGLLPRLKPSSWMSKLKTEDLLKNFEAAQGTKTPLGSVIGSPLLKRQSENVLPHIPFSGASDAQAETADQITDILNGKLSGYLQGKDPKQVNDEIVKEVKKAYEAQNKLKREKYKKAEDIAQEKGFYVKTANLKRVYNHYINAIEDTDFLKYQPDAKDLLKKMAGMTEAFSKNDASKKILGNVSLKNLPDTPANKALKEMFSSGEENIKTSLQEANVFRASLRDLSKKMRTSNLPSDIGKSDVLYAISKALKKDIGSSLRSFGNKELNSAFKHAQKNYGRKFSKFLDKEVYNFIGGKKNAEQVIPEFIKTGATNDRHDLIDKFMNVLTPEGQDLVKYSYLSRALNNDGKINPMKFQSIIGSQKLGPHQLKSLFNKKGEPEQIESLQRLITMNESGLKRMVNPETGQRNLSKMTYTAPTALAGLFGGGPMGAILGLAGLSGGGMLGNKALTSPKLRKHLIKKIIENRKSGPYESGPIRKALPPMLTGIVGGANSDY